MVRRQIRKPPRRCSRPHFSLLPIPLLPWCQNMRAVNDSINPGLVKPEPLPEVPYREVKGGWRDIDVCGRGDHFIAHRSPDLHSQIKGVSLPSPRHGKRPLHSHHCKVSTLSCLVLTRADGLEVAARQTDSRFSNIPSVSGKGPFTNDFRKTWDYWIPSPCHRHTYTT